jgi:hypothetical protein
MEYSKNKYKEVMDQMKNSNDHFSTQLIINYSEDGFDVFSASMIDGRFIHTSIANKVKKGNVENYLKKKFDRILNRYSEEDPSFQKKRLK